MPGTPARPVSARWAPSRPDSTSIAGWCARTDREGAGETDHGRPDGAGVVDGDGWPDEGRAEGDAVGSAPVGDPLGAGGDVGLGGVRVDSGGVPVVGGVEARTGRRVGVGGVGDADGRGRTATAAALGTAGVRPVDGSTEVSWPIRAVGTDPPLEGVRGCWGVVSAGTGRTCATTGSDSSVPSPWTTAR